MPANPKTTLEEFLQHLGFPSAVEEHHLEDGLLLEVKAEDSGRLIGRQGQAVLTAEMVAQRLGTSSYEVVSAILARVPRVD